METEAVSVAIALLGSTAALAALCVGVMRLGLDEDLLVRIWQDPPLHHGEGPLDEPDAYWS